MRSLIEKLAARRDLDMGDINYAVPVLLSEQVEDALKCDFLVALHRKGETVDELVGFVRLLMERAVDPMIDAATLPGPLLDVCGTGGDGFDFFNISTTVMFILAAAGVVVVKHGSRSVTSSCGSADVLEKLGVEIHLTPQELRECVQQLGLGFIFARQFHPAFKAIAEMRKRLAQEKTRTIFSLLGPLLNPARPSRQIVGVFAPRLTMIMAEALQRLGRDRAWVVHGSTEDGKGMDDISTNGATTVADLANGKISSALLDTRWLGVKESSLDDLIGGQPDNNAAILRGILAGEIKGAKRDLAVVNAAAGFVVADHCNDMNEGIALADEQLESGRALAKLAALQNYTAKTSR
jgi:anthranilate phosphoribosyltransferase